MKAQRIVIDVDPRDDLHGRVLAEPGPSRSFSGWIGLLAALEEALGAKRGVEPAKGRKDG